MKLVLHNYWRSSASHRVRIGLGLKHLEYEYVAVNILRHDQGAEAYRARNPMAQVPTLEVTDDRWVRSITQSLPILEYLEERFPTPRILPADLMLRARTRALAEIINSGIQPFQNLTTTKAVKEFGGDDVAWPKRFIADGMAAFEKLARETAGMYCVGDSPTIADCFLIPQMISSRRFGVDVSSHKLLVAIEERCMALPAFQRAAPDSQPDAVK